MSNSTPSAFCLKLSITDDMVFSGASSDAPRCAMILDVSPSLERHLSDIQLLWFQRSFSLFSDPLSLTSMGRG